MCFFCFLIGGSLKSCLFGATRVSKSISKFVKTWDAEPAPKPGCDLLVANEGFQWMPHPGGSITLGATKSLYFSFGNACV